VTPLDDRLVISPADGGVGGRARGAAARAWAGFGGDAAHFGVHECILGACESVPGARQDHENRTSPGKFLNAELDKASAENERNGLVIQSPNGTIACVQIAGLVARRILCWAETGGNISVGERFGLIRFGSRVDVYIPNDAAPRVAVGQTAIAGETVIAEFDAGAITPLVRGVLGCQSRSSPSSRMGAAARGSARYRCVCWCPTSLLYWRSVPACLAYGLPMKAASKLL
jgi:phosphatidylserine decarboxylase